MAKALAKAQVDRYPTCSEFADALRDALGLGPYHLGSSSDPGLSWTGPRGAAGPRLRAPRPLLRAGAGADGAVPPPGQDTEASEVYAARPLALDWLRGRPATQDEAGTPDDQATDPGRPVSPGSPGEPDDSATPGRADPSPPGQHQVPRPDGGPPTPQAGPHARPGRAGQVRGRASPGHPATG